jgi:hypothetical protein
LRRDGNPEQKRWKEQRVAREKAQDELRYQDPSVRGPDERVDLSRRGARSTDYTTLLLFACLTQSRGKELFFGSFSQNFLFLSAIIVSTREYSLFAETAGTQPSHQIFPGQESKNSVPPVSIPSAKPPSFLLSPCHHQSLMCPHTSNWPMSNLFEEQNDNSNLRNSN